MADRGACCLPALLPDDVLADVLRRLPPRHLAACRCACRAWRGVVDSRRLLRADLLPRSLAGVLINFHGYGVTELFSPRPSPADVAVDGKHDYFPGRASIRSWSHVVHHCNGLLLVGGLHLHVLNPATRWWTALPPCPPPTMDAMSCHDEYLAYDPAVSPSFEVVSIPRVYRERSRCRLDPTIALSEWPPSPFVLHVFSSSSTTARWERRSFVREGEAAGIVAAMEMMYGTQEGHAVYWRGILYVNSQDGFLMRMSLSDATYQVIKPPLHNEGDVYYLDIHLGKSEKGVYCALIDGYRLRVWILDESHRKMEWVLTHDSCLLEWFYKEKPDKNVRGPWILQQLNYYYNDRNKDDNSEVSEDEKFEWNS
ncbi:hypothetical protein ACP4OV_008605 [Aristida adscensionis]